MPRGLDEAAAQTRVLMAPANDVVPSDHTTTLPPAPDVPSAVIVAPASIVVFCALAMVCGRELQRSVRSAGAVAADQHGAARLSRWRRSQRPTSG
jgi:hypothetical protein